MQNKSLIIFGASGRTGMVMTQKAKEAGYDVLCPSHQELAIEEEEALTTYILTHKEAAGIINCAAISGIEACLDDALTAHRINAMAPAHMALACRHTGARFIHLSTDYVLEGRKAGLKGEDCRCKPSCVYGMSKWEGEQAILENNPAALIARVSWVCGNPVHPGFVEGICQKALQGDTIQAIADKYSLPSHVDDIAQACLQLIEQEDKAGIIHLCAQSRQALSWWDCAQITLGILQKEGALAEIPCVGKQALREVSFFRDERPRHTGMLSQKAAEWGLPMGSVETTIERAVQNWMQHAKRISTAN